MEVHESPSSPLASSQPSTTAARGGSPTRRRSHYAKPPLSEELFTYTLCLIGSLQHFSYSAGGTRIKEIPLQLDSSVRQLSCGLDWLCLLTDAGRVYSFGSNTYGQLAQGHTHVVAHPKPVLFSVEKRIVRISCGSSHGGFLLESGALFMFGCGSYGRLGTGNESSQSSPVAVKMRWKELEAMAAELTREPRTTIPGFARSSSQTASSSTTMASSGTAPPVDEDDDDVVFVDISCGDRHTLLLAAKPVPVSNSTVKKQTKNHIIAFGDGMNGRLGLGSEKDHATGVLLTQFQTSVASYTPTFAAIHAGASHNTAISTAGEIFTWGNGTDGQLGHGSYESEWVPREVQFFRGNSMASAKCGAKHTVAISRTGVVYAWGRGLEGQLGSGSLVAGTSQPQRVTLVVDPVAAQQAQIEAQLATGASFSVASLSGSTGNMIMMPDTRVVVRTLAVRENTTMALDEQSRLFVWGDNSMGQLGLDVQIDLPDDDHCPPEQQPGTDYVATAKQLSYMELRERKRLASRVRDRVLASASANLPRVGLAHMEASDRFSVLLLGTKQPTIGQGLLDGEMLDGSPQQASVGDVTKRLMRQRSTIVYGLDDKVRWQFSLTEPLQIKDVPSREAAFYNYMARYKVSIRRTELARDCDEEDGEWMDGDPSSTKRHASQLRGQTGGYHGKRRSSMTAMSPEMRAQLQSQFRSDHAEEDGVGDAGRDRSEPTGCRSPRSACAAVKGFNVWLQRKLSPSKASRCGSSARRFPPDHPRNVAISTPNQKEDHVAAPTRPQSSAPTKPRRPAPPKSAFGRSTNRSVSLGPNGRPRRPTTAAPSGSTSRSASIVTPPPDTPSSTSPPAPKDTRQRLFNQFVAPFGSSVASRFGVRSPHANDSLRLDIHPAQSVAAVLPRSPNAMLGSNADHFSLVIARRLHDARGTSPGPGTYDRHGG